MREETLQAITEMIYGEGSGPPDGGSPFFDMLLELIEDEIDFAVGEEINRQLLRRVDCPNPLLHEHPNPPVAGKADGPESPAVSRSDP